VTTLDRLAVRAGAVHHRQFHWRQINRRSRYRRGDFHERQVGAGAVRISHETLINRRWMKKLVLIPHLYGPRGGDHVRSGEHRPAIHNAARSPPVPWLGMISAVGDHLNDPSGERDPPHDLPTL
jgi:hypothetical protein